MKTEFSDQILSYGQQIRIDTDAEPFDEVAYETAQLEREREYWEHFGRYDEEQDLCEEDRLAREEAEWQMQDRQRNQ